MMTAMVVKKKTVITYTIHTHRNQSNHSLMEFSPESEREKDRLLNQVQYYRVHTMCDTVNSNEEKKNISSLHFQRH